MSTLHSLSEGQDQPPSKRESDIHSLRGNLTEKLSGSESYKDLVLRFQHEKPELYQNALDHLEESYCLGKEDMADYSYALYTVLFCANGRAEFLRLLRTDDNLLPLLKKSVANALSKVTGKKADEMLVDSVFSDVQANLDGKFQSMRTFIQPFLTRVRNLTEQSREKSIPKRRQEALQQMDIKYAHFFNELRCNERALTDQEMVRDFSARNSAGSRYLTTYFDTAQFGIRNNCLARAADEVAWMADEGWDSFVEQMKFRVTFPLERINGNGLARRFRPQGVSFHPNGTLAFNAFMMSCMRPGDRVLASTEEYGEMIANMEKNGIEVVKLSEFSKVSAFREEIMEVLRSSRFDYLLISEVGRLGTVFPLAEVNGARQLSSPRTKYVVDSCQTAGRLWHDMAACHPDALICSTNKGSDFGQGLGVVAVANDFSVPGMKTNVQDTGLHDYSGTIYHEAMARTGYAMMVEGLPLPEELAHYAISPKIREEAIRRVATNCVALIREINFRHGSDSKEQDKIQIIHPLNCEQLGHVLELKVKGVSREELCSSAKSYGVHIADFYFDAHDDESVRIAFHPWMGNESLKILGYVLDRACEPKKV